MVWVLPHPPSSGSQSPAVSMSTSRMGQHSSGWCQGCTASGWMISSWHPTCNSLLLLQSHSHRSYHHLPMGKRRKNAFCTANLQDSPTWQLRQQHTAQWVYKELLSRDAGTAHLSAAHPHARAVSWNQNYFHRCRTPSVTGQEILPDKTKHPKWCLKIMYAPKSTLASVQDGWRYWDLDKS